MAKRNVVNLQAAPARITATKLDLACGNNKLDGYFGIDLCQTPSADAVLDLLKWPWPVDDGSVDEINCSHFFEHIPGPQRFGFMDECWRILKVGGRMVIVCPYWSSMRSIQDPTHAWPPVCETSFLYFNRDWRKNNRLDHYPVMCDFDYTYGYAMDNDLLSRSQEHQVFAVKHYLQSVNDVQIGLTKRP